VTSGERFGKEAKAMIKASSIPGQMLLDHDVLERPNPFYRRLVEEAPVWPVGDTDVYTINSYEAVTEACRRVEDFSSNLRYFLYRDDDGLPARERHARADEDGAQVFASADPPTHGQHKKLISPEFSPNRIASLESRLVKVTRERLASGLDTGRIEFMSELANIIPIEVITDLISFKEHNREALFEAAILQTDMLAGAISRDELRKRTAFSDDTFMWVLQQLQDSRAAPGKGILGLLARAINDNETDVTVAMAILMTLFAAGGESTSSLIGNSALILAQNQELQQRLRKDPALIPKFIEESLRLESPFRHHMRLVTKNTRLAGVNIREGSTLLLMWGAANRDPAMFDRPDEVDLERPRRHVGFGSGIHVCLGNTLARLEARVVLETLLASTNEITLDDAEAAKWVPSLLVRRLHSLPLALLPR
jgi:cytochrome P450